MGTDKRPAAAAGAPYLPAELIPDIARHLTSLQDFFALRAACRAYRAALPPSRAVLAAQPPHLLIPHHASSRPHLALAHLPRRRLLRFRESSPVPNSVLASDGARVLTFDPFARSLHVTHLLSGERARAPDVPFLFSRAVLTGDLVLLTAPGWVGYCRLGDGLWREADCRLGDRDADLWCRAPFNGVYMMVAMRSVNGALYALLNTCQLAVAELLDNKVELKLLGGEVDEHVRDAWMESKDFILGECAGDPLLIFKFKVSVNPAYKVFRWEPGEERWVRVRSLGRRTLFMSINGFDAWLIPDSPGVRGDCIYEALPRAAGWSEYSLVDGTCELVTIEYQGAPGVDAARTQIKFSQERRSGCSRVCSELLMFTYEDQVLRLIDINSRYMILMKLPPKHGAMSFDVLVDLHGALLRCASLLFYHDLRSHPRFLHEVAIHLCIWMLILSPK